MRKLMNKSHESTNISSKTDYITLIRYHMDVTDPHDIYHYTDKMCNSNPTTTMAISMTSELIKTKKGAT